MHSHCPLCSGSGSRSAVVERRLHGDPRQRLLIVQLVACDGCHGTGMLPVKGSNVMQFYPKRQVAHGERRELEAA